MIKNFANRSDVKAVETRIANAEQRLMFISAKIEEMKRTIFRLKEELSNYDVQMTYSTANDFYS